MDYGGTGVKSVVDTNVIAYFLLGTRPFLDEVRQFWHQVDETLAPSLWEAELANVVWMAVRAGLIAIDEGPERLRAANRLGIQSVPSRALWEGALVRGVLSGIAVYDSLFVELAVREKVPMATFDGKLISAFPRIAKRPGLLLSI